MPQFNEPWNEILKYQKEIGIKLSGKFKRKIDVLFDEFK